MFVSYHSHFFLPYFTSVSLHKQFVGRSKDYYQRKSCCSFYGVNTYSSNPPDTHTFLKKTSYKVVLAVLGLITLLLTVQDLDHRWAPLCLAAHIFWGEEHKSSDIKLFRRFLPGYFSETKKTTLVKSSTNFISWGTKLAMKVKTRQINTWSRSKGQDHK